MLSRMTGNVLASHAADGLLPPVFDMSNLEEFCNHRHEDAGTQKQNKSQLNPDEIINNAVDF